MIFITRKKTKQPATGFFEYYNYYPSCPPQAVGIRWDAIPDGWEAKHVQVTTQTPLIQHCTELEKDGWVLIGVVYSSLFESVALFGRPARPEAEPA